MAQLTIRGNKRYVRYMSKHLRKEHPSTKKTYAGKRNIKAKKAALMKRNKQLMIIGLGFFIISLALIILIQSFIEAILFISGALGSAFFIGGIINRNMKNRKTKIAVGAVMFIISFSLIVYLNGSIEALLYVFAGVGSGLFVGGLKRV